MTTKTTVRVAKGTTVRVANMERRNARIYMVKTAAECAQEIQDDIDSGDVRDSAGESKLYCDETYDKDALQYTFKVVQAKNVKGHYGWGNISPVLLQAIENGRFYRADRGHLVNV